MFKLDGPKTLTLRAESVALVLDALAELPYKRVHNTMGEIFSQLAGAQIPKEQVNGSSGGNSGDQNGVLGARDREADQVTRTAKLAPTED